MAIARHNADLVSVNYKYVMQIIGVNDEGKHEIDNFTNPEKHYPLVEVTSELLTTGIDAQILEALLDKYADEGITNMESMEVLRVQPLSDFGSPTEIINEFGSKEKYLQAIRELEIELYKNIG